MPNIDATLQAHLASCATTVCHAWQIIRRDKVRFAFTDHDQPVKFGDITFEANSGLGAKALAQTTGLSVDNTEAIGALNDASLREDEIEQGRFDGAEVKAWLVNWAKPEEHWLQFRGTIGEILRVDGVFRAELRGLTEALNRPLGRVYQKPCTAVLGDKQCRLGLQNAAFFANLTVQSHEGGRVFTWEDLGGFDAGWFARGRLDVLDGPAAGLWGLIKHDRFDGTSRVIELWEPIRGAVAEGTAVKLIAGCDKRLQTCRLKFNNIRNFQGFPDLPGEDFLLAVPKGSGTNSGGSLR
jgi:uncharacterized phage protein (TIGR02218 family)